jgi:hypothetical protein
MAHDVLGPEFRGGKRFHDHFSAKLAKLRSLGIATYCPRTTLGKVALQAQRSWRIGIFRHPEEKAMRLVKHLGAACLQALPQICGSVFVVAVMANTLHARPKDVIAPEIDPASITSAITLLACGVLLITGRRWKK